MTENLDAIAPDGGTLVPRWGRVRAVVGAPWFAPMVVTISVVAVFFSLAILLGRTGFRTTSTVTRLMMMLNGVTALALVALIIRDILALRHARRIGIAASRLHERVVRRFGLVSAIPVMIVAVVAMVMINRAFDLVVSPDLTRAVDSSVRVADVYYKEQIAALKQEAIGISTEIEQMFKGETDGQTDFKPDKLRELLRAQAIVRGFATLAIMRQDGVILDRVDMRAQSSFMPPGDNVLDEVAKSSDVFAIISSQPDGDYLQAVFRTHPTNDRFAYVVRPINREIIAHLRAAQRGSLDLKALNDQRLSIQLALAQTFMLVTLLVLLAAVYTGLSFANRLVAPIRQLIGAAGAVAGGDLRAQVQIPRSEGDLAKLGETFNTMTGELQSQRDALVHASDVMDSRRRFSEAVLAGVSAGVIGLDDDGHVTIANPIAADMLALQPEAMTGKLLTELAPEFAPLLGEAMRGGSRAHQGQLTLLRSGKERTLAVRVTSERDDTGGNGMVVTFDDITELMTAQRSSAWADIARRIAHEIKNPLTPIQLSAERLRRRYGKVIVEDREVFDQCTSTIIRQVGDIGRMVDEFSSFARMPRATYEQGDVGETVRQVVFLMRMGNPDITIEAQVPPAPVIADFDRRLISQGLTNLVKNAAEAIAGVEENEHESGLIQVRLSVEGDEAVIDVEDNGRGLPRENRQRLLEPYVTTREKGTGLGLAIVGRIIEDHGGRIELLDALPRADGTQRGALIRLRFKLHPAAPEPGAASLQTRAS